MKRDGRDLTAALADPGFTPSVRHVAELVALAADEVHGEAVERALARLEGALAAAVAPHVAGAASRARVHVYRALGRTASSAPDVLALAIAGLADADERPRRAAATALGKLALPAAAKSEAEAALLARWERAETDSERRVIAEAPSRHGGERAAAVLAGWTTNDVVLKKAVAKARLVLDREARRESHGGVRGDVAPARPLPVVFFVRRGLEHFVVDELGAGDWHASIVGPGRVRATLHGALATAFVSRCAERFAIALPDVTLGPREALDDALVRALVDAEPIVAPLTEGAARFRIAWAKGGHKRAVVWSIAEKIAAASRVFTNDPSSSLWELSVDERRAKGGEAILGLTLAPRGLPDPRFAYRQKDVPAASHPTLAAALAHAAGANADDVVWDPFVGSGLELVERAKLGPYVALSGSDLEESALEVARMNLHAAGVQAALVRADALTHFPRGTNLIVTNPPMGRRVRREGGGIGDFLADFVTHAARKLPPGGRLVWLSSQWAATRDAAKHAGFSVDGAATVDMGGFEAELQIMTRRAR